MARIEENYVEFPLSRKNRYRTDTLPIVIKSNSELMAAIEVVFEVANEKGSRASSGHGQELLAKYIEERGLPISLELNGKLRSYHVTLKGFKKVPMDERSAVIITLSGEEKSKQ